jgi:diguanylate cyclase (GGDEF)-like protein
MRMSIAAQFDAGHRTTSAELDEARRIYWEDPSAALATAVRCQEVARTRGHADLRGRALAIQGAVMLHRGDLRGAAALAVDAEPYVELSGGDEARIELAALKAHLSFFSGSYAEALLQAERAMELADRGGDVTLRVFARRAACLVFGNVGVRSWPDRLDELLELSIASGNRWEEAISRNDLGCLKQSQGDLEGAEVELERGLAIARDLAPLNRFALGVLHSTRADMRLLADRPEEALADAEEALAHLVSTGEPNPYVFGITVRAQVEAFLALGRTDEAQRSGEGALRALGDRVPQARSLILATVATALRKAGRIEDAYDTLSRSAELERRAFHELSELRLGLERATLEAGAARREADVIAAKNRRLEELVRELAEAHAELEALQEQLREQADRDWLTGLHNRRYLAREVDRLAAERLAEQFSFAVLDLDHFKSINDAFGHDIGDRVLVRVAGLLLDELRGDDIVVRTGGEEFVLLMPHTPPSAAAACCERVRAAIRDEPWGAIAAGLRVSASIGIASLPDATDLDALGKLADRRLYAAKRAGRDRVVAV